MKKAPRRLVLHRQTVRVLAHIDLARAVGGGDSVAAPCPGLADSGAKACGTETGVVATNTCG